MSQPQVKEYVVKIWYYSSYILNVQKMTETCADCKSLQVNSLTGIQGWVCNQHVAELWRHHLQFAHLHNSQFTVKLWSKLQNTDTKYHVGAVMEPWSHGEHFYGKLFLESGWKVTAKKKLQYHMCTADGTVIWQLWELWYHTRLMEESVRWCSSTECRKYLF